MKISSPLPHRLLGFFNAGSPVYKPGARFLVACSAGPDSVALVLALKEISALLPFKFFLAHVNHRLRGQQSEQDARFVAKLARKVGWPSEVVLAPVRPLPHGNLEETAREMRYAALVRLAKKRNCGFVLTAHHLDDQVESILMNLFRGTGVQGLGGMSDRRPLGSSKIQLVRPFLEIEKSELLAYVKSKKERFRRDASNENELFFRNWLRRRVVPLLEKRSPGFKTRIARLGTLVRDEESYWAGIVSELMGRLLRPRGSGQLLDLKGLLSYPAAVQRRFLRRAAGGDLLSFGAVERWRRWMSRPPSSGRIWQLRKGWVVERLSKSKGSPSATHYLLRKETNS